MNSIVWSYEFDAGHRLLGHAGKCRFPHGHRYRAEIEVEGLLDDLGMVIDFGVMKDCIGSWIDDHWDHGFITSEADEDIRNALESFGRLFVMEGNPTAENMATYLLQVVRGALPKNVRLIAVTIWETPTCRARCTG